MPTKVSNWITAADDPERWRRTVEDNSTPRGSCVVWTGTLDRYGYGVFRVGGGRVTGAHRAAWLARRGELADGLVLDHLCRNRACVNVEHMEAVSVQVNTIRGNGGKKPFPRGTHCVNGHEYTPENSRWRQRRGYNIRECRTCVAAGRRRRESPVRVVS